MKIGIDMDNTICSTDKKVGEYEKIFTNNHNIDSYTIWHNNYYFNLFLSEYLEIIYTEVEPKENVVSCINRLKEHGNEIYIITARTNNYVTDMYKIIDNYCSKHNIKIDGIFIDAKDKVDICKENNIDIMIDDSFYNYDRLTTNNIKTILFDEYDKHTYIKSRILSWKDLKNSHLNVK